jgi:hypothetical protein
LDNSNFHQRGNGEIGLIALTVHIFFVNLPNEVRTCIVMVYLKVIFKLLENSGANPHLCCKVTPAI